MAQMNWIYVDNTGQRHNVGFYHGDKTGHLLIYCDHKIMQVDFSVKESTFYSFFIQDELCEVHLVKEKNGQFGYEFKINKEIDTPLNQERKKLLRFERKQIAIGIGVMALFIVGLLYYNRYQKQKKEYESMSERSIIGVLTPDQVTDLQLNGKGTTATFYVMEEQGIPVARYTFYTLDSQMVSGKVTSIDGGQLYLPTGFAIGDRHVFKAQYVPNAPSVHRINFYEPNAETLAKYIEQAKQVQKLSHPEHSERYNYCLVDAVKEQRHWTALTHIMHQNDDKKSKKAYLRLVNDVDVARVVQQRCGI